MQARDAIQKLIAQSGEKVSRWRSWEQAANKEATPLLRESRPSGYSNWFVVEKDKAIWWIYYDTSDGGVWSSEGMAVTGFKIQYDEKIAQNIYELVYAQLVKK